MNRKEKGFTLVEIIGVIVLMGLVITIGSTTINNIKNVSREKLYNEQINRLVSVSKTWAIENTNKMPSTIGDTYQVGIDRLVKEGYLKSNEIIDVRDNSKITGCVEIAYNSVNSYDYSYVTKDSCYDYDTVYTITYDLDGGVLENSNPTSYRNSTPTFLINNPTKAGYSFTGWEDISNPGIYNMLLKIKIGSKGNKYFKAIWTLDVNIVTIDPNGGLYENSSDIKNVEVLSFSSLDISVPTRNGYVFNGWTVEGYATLEGNTLSINKENVTLTANWRKISALTLNLNGGTSSQGLSHQLVEGASINLTTPTRTGYTFSGWEVLGTSEKITNGKYTMGSNDTIVMALWTPITYTLTVNPNGGTLNGSTANRTYSMQYGETRGIANPTRDGYIFGGWTVSGTESSMNGTVFQMGTANATITAKWKSLKPSYTYTGESQLIDDGDGNWRIKFITSGTLTFNDLGNGSSGVDIFLVGGGGGGGSTRTQTIRGSFGKHSNSWGTYNGAYINRNDGGGGGGGYTKTMTNISMAASTSYNIVIGAGGAAGSGDNASGSAGGTTQISNITDASVSGGSGGTYEAGGNGGSGGGASAYHKQWTVIPCTANKRACLSVSDEYTNATAGASDGGSSSGTGQGRTTREFGSSTGTLYAGGGGGGAQNNTSGSNAAGGSGGGGAGHIAGAANTGGGGGGGSAGGSGIVIIRNHASSWTTGGVSYTYTGDSEFISDGGDNWRIKFLTSGTLTFSSLGTASSGIDLFLVGGGSAEGGGGYTATHKGLSIAKGTSYSIVVGSGGTSSSVNGGTSSGFGKSVNGGQGKDGGSGAGGSGYVNDGATGGSNGGNGGLGGDNWTGGTGQGTTTREFGESSGALYAGGGGTTGGAASTVCSATGSNGSDGTYYINTSYATLVSGSNGSNSGNGSANIEYIGG